MASAWPGTSTRPRTRRSSPRCRAWAGSARTAAATWSATTPKACSSRAAPTSRSSSEAAGSSWARSTRHSRRCRRSPAPRPRSATARPATSCWSGTSYPKTRRVRPGQGDRATRARSCPAALVPLLAVVDTLPTRTSGKVDRNALPWPLPGMDGDGPAGRAQRDRGLAGRALDEGPRRDGHRPGQRLLPARRRQPGRRPAGVRTARAVPGRDRRRHLRVPALGALADRLDESQPGAACRSRSGRSGRRRRARSSCRPRSRSSCRQSSAFAGWSTCSR